MTDLQRECREILTFSQYSLSILRNTLWLKTRIRPLFFPEFLEVDPTAHVRVETSNVLSDLGANAKVGVRCELGLFMAMILLLQESVQHAHSDAREGNHKGQNLPCLCWKSERKRATINLLNRTSMYKSAQEQILGHNKLEDFFRTIQNKIFMLWHSTTIDLLSLTWNNCVSTKALWHKVASVAELWALIICQLSGIFLPSHL